MCTARTILSSLDIFMSITSKHAPQISLLFYFPWATGDRRLEGKMYVVLSNVVYVLSCFVMYLSLSFNFDDNLWNLYFFIFWQASKNRYNSFRQLYGFVCYVLTFRVLKKYGILTTPTCNFFYRIFFFEWPVQKKSFG